MVTTKGFFSFFFKKKGENLWLPLCTCNQIASHSAPPQHKHTTQFFADQIVETQRSLEVMNSLTVGELQNQLCFCFVHTLQLKEGGEAGKQEVRVLPLKWADTLRGAGGGDVW